MGDWSGPDDPRFERTEDHFLSTGEAAARAEVSYRQADYWLRTGVIAIDGPATPGGGKARRWSEDDVAVLLILGRISAAFNGKIDRSVLQATATAARTLVGNGWAGDPVYVELSPTVQLVVETD